MVMRFKEILWITEVYALIQASGLDANIKALEKAQTLIVCECMVGKTFSGVSVGLADWRIVRRSPTNFLSNGKKSLILLK